MRMPATIAPTIGDRPAAVVASAATMTTSRLADRNSSGLLVRAACANRRGRSSRPNSSIAPTTTTPSSRIFPSAPEIGAAARAQAPRGRRRSAPGPDPRTAAWRRRSGRPGWSFRRAGRTSAVEERVRARPTATAPPGREARSGRAYRPGASADSSSSAAPRPKTARRIAHRRRKDSSSPIAKSSRMIPNSANG